VRLRPLYDKVVLREVPADVEQTTPSGLFLPETMRPEVLEGEVVAVGEGTPLEGLGVSRPVRVKKGDRVLFHTLTGREVTLGEETFRVIREGEIIAVLVAE
jgi:chaperonin GroES